MTYATYLLIFLCLPLAVLSAVTVRAAGAVPGPAATQPAGWVRSRLPVLALIMHVVVAVVYTTPWDNYLVATRVWWYEPARVVGLTLGWVPLEEYCFFVLQTLVTGLWLLLLMRRSSPAHVQADGAAGWRWRPWRPGLAATSLMGLLWLASLAMLWANWKPGSYLSLEVSWFLPPIILQIIIGGDILWQRRRLALAALLPPIVYLAATDAFAIAQGTWTIDPRQTLGILLGSVFPLEELVFFTLTNVLIVFGMILIITIGQRLPDANARLYKHQDENCTRPQGRKNHKVTKTRRNAQYCVANRQ